MTNTFQEFKDNPDKDTLIQMWCEFITAMAEDKMPKDEVMRRLLRCEKNSIAIVELCGMAPSQLYAATIAREENKS